MITKKNILNHELIGLKVMIEEKKYEGRVVDETKNSLVVKTNNGTKRLIKENNVFVFELPKGERVRVYGNIIKYRPWDRLKKKIKVKNRWQKILG